MNAMCRSCLCVVFVVGCGAAQTEEKPGPQRAEYDRFIQPYTAEVPSGWFSGPKVPLKLIVTAIVGDDPQAHAKDPYNSRESRYGCQVATDGRVYHFDIGPFGAKGGDSTIPSTDLKRLDALLMKLPDDGVRLPPFDRRVVVQVPEGNHCRARVYDRANAPDEVLEILRLTESRIGPWVLQFKPENTADGSRYNYDTKNSAIAAYDSKTWQRGGTLPGLPDGVHGYVESRTRKHAVILLKDKTLALWDPAGHRNYAKIAASVESFKVAFSPDESIVAIASEKEHGNGYWPCYRIRLWKTDAGRLLHELYPSWQVACNAVDGLQWTADSKFVFAATRAISPDNYAIDVWNVGSGRLRGTVDTGICMPFGGLVMLPDGRHVAFSGSGHVMGFWDLAAALKQIREFEDSLVGPKAKK